MRVLVYLEQIYDPRLPLTISGAQVVPDGSPPAYEISPASRAALEWAAAHASGFGAACAGAPEVEPALRAALALGAREALRLDAGGDVSPADAAALAAQQVSARSIDLVLCGDGPFGPTLAETRGWPQVTRVVELHVTGGELRAVRLLERGDRQTVACRLPAVITFHPTTASPAYLSQLRLERAARLPIQVVDGPAPDPTSPALTQVEIGPPRPRPRRMAAPSAGMSASQRMSFLMGGAQKRPTATENRLVEGDPEQAAQKIFDFLKERGFL